MARLLTQRKGSAARAAKLREIIRAFPAEIQILGEPWRITWVHSIPVGRGDDRREHQAFGDSDIDTRTIRLSRATCTTAQIAADTLLHEIIHAVLGISGHTAALGPAAEEDVVTALERGLRRLITLNALASRKDS